MLTPYLMVFAISTSLVAAAASRFNHSRLVRWACSAIAIGVVSIFAGVRDFSVGGPDVLIYGNKVFNAMALTESLANITTYASERGASGEIGYYFLNWFVSRFTTDPHVYYTVLAAFCSTVILIAIVIVRDYGPPAVMWLTYMLTAYVEGFNLLRQGPALALAVLGVALVLRNRFRAGLAIGTTGLLFHNSAVVFLVMWVVAVYLKSRKEHIGRSIFLVLLLSVVALVAIAPALELLSGSLGDSKYQEYLGSSARGGRAFGVDALYRALPIVLGIWVLVATSTPPATPAVRNSRTTNLAIYRNTLTRDASETRPRLETATRRALIVVLVLLSLELILLPIREISYPFYRLLAYFGYLRILGYGIIVGALPRHRFAGGVIAVSFAAAYFLLIVIDRNEAFYSSTILDEWTRAR